MFDLKSSMEAAISIRANLGDAIRNPQKYGIQIMGGPIEELKEMTERRDDGRLEKQRPV